MLVDNGRDAVLSHSRERSGSESRHSDRTHRTLGHHHRHTLMNHFLFKKKKKKGSPDVVAF